MSTKKLIFTFIAAFTLILLLVACGKTPTATPVQNTTNTQVPVTTTQETPLTTTPPKTVPEDVPIMPDAYDLQVASQLNVEYKVKAQIKDIVTFYQEQLPQLGWDQSSNPDSVVGSMATMARSKTNGDRINLAFQWNMVGEFTVVTVYLTRAP